MIQVVSKQAKHWRSFLGPQESSREAQTPLKVAACSARSQLKQVFHGLLSPYLGMVRLRFVNEICCTHSPEAIHMLSFHLH